MKMLFLLIILGGCTTIGSYQPKTGPIADNIQYKKDLSDCKEFSSPKPVEVAMMSAFGFIGQGILVASGDTRVIKSTFTLIDECMINKGYDITS